MRKLIHLLFAVSLLLYFSTVIVSAETAAYKNFQNVYEEAEFQAVMDTVENDPFIQEANVLGAALEDGAAVQPMNPYKLYAMPAVDFKNFTGNERDITGNDSDNYLWVLPVSNGNVIRVQSIENNWQVIGYSTPSETASDTDIIALASLPETMDGSLLCFEIPEYHTSFVYCATADGVRLIPYGSRPDLTGLANGKSYSISEVQKILGDTFNATPAPEELTTISGSDGGGPTVTVKNTNTGIWVIIIIGFIISLCVGAVCKYRRQCSR